jgi:hypothetical protein
MWTVVANIKRKNYETYQLGQPTSGSKMELGSIYNKTCPNTLLQV